MLHRVVKKKHRSFADLAAIYGSDLVSIERNDYERFVGLWLNRYRELFRSGRSAQIGVLAALQQTPLGTRPPLTYYSAITDHEQEAEYLADVESSKGF